MANRYVWRRMYTTHICSEHLTQIIWVYKFNVTSEMECQFEKKCFLFYKNSNYLFIVKKKFEISDCGGLILIC